ncbi:hypothetical protein SX4_0899 [Vibrio mimicus SX-4]|uniref:Uncharacterized protein n=1 Tax=Vibrio mimicus TaxID=674 RepID=A0A2J9V3Q8_VIBMI|nr:hypothetical protein VMD_20120 [Vibrio mimicus VM573]EGU18221.1 hypothetical protein SX4_0899 [Vibrio mimicus SX-4]PNM58408.1 hypothetical protein AL544_007180 [Vibrio mimicus]
MVRVCLSPLASVTMIVTILPCAASALPIMVGVVSLVLSGASTVIFNVAAGSSGITGEIGDCSRLSKLKLWVLERPRASKPEVSNWVAARVSAPSRSMVVDAVSAEPCAPPAAGASSSSKAVGSAPCSSAARICCMSSVMGRALPSASTSFAVGFVCSSGTKLPPFGSRTIAPSGIESPALTTTTFPFLSMTSNWLDAKFVKDDKALIPIYSLKP